MKKPRKSFNLIFLSVFIFSVTIFALGVTPHYTCGCGKIESGTKLTYFVNQISETIVGRPLFDN